MKSIRTIQIAALAAIAAMGLAACGSGSADTATDETVGTAIP